MNEEWGVAEIFGDLKYWEWLYWLFNCSHYWHAFTPSVLSITDGVLWQYANNSPYKHAAAVCDENIAGITGVAPYGTCHKICHSIMPWEHSTPLNHFQAKYFSFPTELLSLPFSGNTNALTMKARILLCPKQMTCQA